jgi:endonuclease/exonuclease/phosphatase family metal-dependent hydrolase
MRVVTYNIHKCRGLDRAVRPDRIVSVLREIDADVIAMQEVICKSNSRKEMDQGRYIADELGYEYILGSNRMHGGGAYGNVVLSRLPVVEANNYDISVHKRERRGCLRVDIDAGDAGIVHFFNIHLGTAFMERRHQGRKLISEEILNSTRLLGPRVVLGDFNEWTKGLASRLLAQHLRSADVKLHLRTGRTYPGIFPFLHLDHVYYDSKLKLQNLSLHRSRTALIASDHLPLVAEFAV